ncbi:MAG TPA: hypothetical protein VLM85_13775 [Polyangiaceae bacterium]|nr:hypothetical protein [Polyangiaceae bacterium]
MRKSWLVLLVLLGCKRELEDGPVPSSSSTAAATAAASLAAPVASSPSASPAEGTLSPLNLGGGGGASAGSGPVTQPIRPTVVGDGGAVALPPTAMPSNPPALPPVPSGFTLPTSLPGLSAVPSSLVPPPWQPPR